jgi:16S rRNA (uracil1498-N3)-methyltransferase
MSRDSQAQSRVRLFVSAALGPGQTVALTDGQAHYLLRVMRLGPGRSVRLFNGRDGEWLAHLKQAGRGPPLAVVERLIRSQEVEDGPWLAFAPVKKQATDFIVEKATELGASKLWPVVTERTVARRVNADRLLAIATEAAEQCGRMSVPEVLAPSTLPALAAAWPQRRAMLVAHPGTGAAPLPILDAIANLYHLPATAEPAKPAAFLIGPEGGLTPAELDLLAGLPCAKIVGLGGLTLRAETAAAAALSCWQAMVEARIGGAMARRSTGKLE